MTHLIHHNRPPVPASLPVHVQNQTCSPPIMSRSMSYLPTLFSWPNEMWITFSSPHTSHKKEHLLWLKNSNSPSLTNIIVYRLFTWSQHAQSPALALSFVLNSIRTTPICSQVSTLMRSPTSSSSKGVSFSPPVVWPVRQSGWLIFSGGGCMVQRQWKDNTAKLCSGDYVRSHRHVLRCGSHVVLLWPGSDSHYLHASVVLKQQRDTHSSHYSTTYF